MSLDCSRSCKFSYWYAGYPLLDTYVRIKHMQEVLSQLVQSLEYIGVGGLMMLFANELIMPLAGFLAWNGDMNLTGVVIAGTLGSTFGSWVMYGIARVVDHRRIYRAVDKYGTWFGANARTLKHTEAWFDRHAKGSVFFGKLFPGTRSAASLIAGYRRMPVWVFLGCTLASTAVSASLLAGLGYYISEQFASISTVAAYASNIFVLLLLTGLLGYGWYRHRKYGH